MNDTRERQATRTMDALIHVLLYQRQIEWRRCVQDYEFAEWWSECQTDEEQTNTELGLSGHSEEGAVLQPCYEVGHSIEEGRRYWRVVPEYHTRIEAVGKAELELAHRGHGDRYINELVNTLGLDPNHISPAGLWKLLNAPASARTTAVLHVLENIEELKGDGS